MAKPKMSAEEAAVRKALAAVQADTGVARAQEILRTGVVPTPTATSGKISDIDTSTALGKEAAKRLGQAQSYVDKTEPIIAQKYDDLGYVYNPNTGQTTPKVNTSGDTSGNKNVDIDKDTRNAFAILKQVFAQYDLGDLSSVLETLMKEGYEPEEAALALKTNPEYNKAYITRFKGNETRRTAGLNVLSESEYLTLENDYTQTLKSYGLESYFGVDRTTKLAAMSDIIGKDISSVEFADRVDTSVTRVKMASQSTKDAFRQFYGIGEADLVKYFLDPVKSLVSLKEKATSAEIGGAAIGQGLTTTMTSAEDLARFGINRQQAQAGYASIGEELPTATKLGNIYSETGTTYGQTDAEEATFKGLASAKRKKERLIAVEEAQFSGGSGTGINAFTNSPYVTKGSSAGQF